MNKLYAAIFLVLSMSAFNHAFGQTITSFTPYSANVNNKIELTGTNFTGATAVSFGGVAAASFTVNSATSITAVLSPGSASGDVSVTTPAGTAKSAGFIFNSTPVISYKTPPTLVAGIAITPLTITRSGGTFPQGMYGKVSTYAGSGLYGSSNGALATASFANPLGLATDKSGTIYIAEANANLIRKIAPDGTVSTVAGTGTAGDADGPAATAQFNYPSAVAIDVAGNLYITDSGNKKVRKISANGIVSTINYTFDYPYGITTTPDGSVYVANTYSNNIKKIIPDGTVTNFAGDPDGKNFFTGGPFFPLFGITTATDGNFYALQGVFATVIKISPAGVVSTKLGSFPSYGMGLAIDGIGNAYVTDTLTNVITKLDPLLPNQYSLFAGHDTTKFQNFPNGRDGIDTTALFGRSSRLAYDGNGNILVADAGHSQIKKVSLTGYYLDKPLPKGLTFDYATGTISGTPLAVTPAADYHISAYNAGAVGTTTITIGVSLGTQTIAFNPIPAKTYGDADFDPGATSNNTATPVTYTSSDTTIAKMVSGKLHILGAGSITLTATQPASASFNAAIPVAQTLTINPAILTVGVYNAIRAVGLADPKFYLTISGYVNKEDSTVITQMPVARSATDVNTAPGDYPLTISGGLAKNYTFKYVPGILTIIPVPVINASGPTTFKSGGSVVLTAAPASNAYTYQWFKDAVAIPGATSASYTATDGGFYTVSLHIPNYTTFATGVTLTSVFSLPANNFKIIITSATCRGSNNGSINITAAQTLNYVANITGGITSSLPFTNKLDISNLAPGTYNICITVTGQTYSQCFSTIVTEPKDLSVYTAVNKNASSLTLSLDGGSTYNINLNGINYTTTANTISLPLIKGNNQLSVSTDLACQGLVDRSIVLADKIIPYPDPFQDVLYLNLGDQVAGNATATIHSAVDGKLVYSNKYSNIAGVVQLDVSKLNNGLYVLMLSLDNHADMVFKILKK